MIFKNQILCSTKARTNLKQSNIIKIGYLEAKKQRYPHTHMSFYDNWTMIIPNWYDSL